MRRRTLRWVIVIASALVVALVGGLVVGAVVAKRVETGQWQAPEVADVVELVQGPEPPRASKTIFLDRSPLTITPGDDDGPRNVSAVVLVKHPQGPVKVPGWKGSKSGWTKLVKCVSDLFAPFDVTVTDQPPAHDDFVRVAVGGRPKDIGVADKHVTGLAPFNGQVIPRAFVFAFAAQMGHDVRATCETIGMEVAHAYGLDHAFLCKDVMTYLRGCGSKKFVDQDVPCGEKKARVCKGGAPTQNSFRMLTEILGAAPARAAASK